MKKNPKPLIYFILGIALVALSNSTLALQTPTRIDLVVWGLVGVVGVVFVIIITPIHLYFWFKNRKVKRQQS